jgi:hypothetical protein
MGGRLFLPDGNHFNGAADAHFLPAVVEFFSAVEADDVSASPGSFRKFGSAGWR